MNRSHLTCLVLVLQLTFSPLRPTRLSLASARTLTEEQKITHLLNRTGFGPKPGDVDRVRKMGIERYLDQQLHPEKIDDSAAQSRLQGLETLTMSSAELVDNFPRPRLKANSSARETKDGQPGEPMDDPEARRELRAAGLNAPRRVIGELSQAKVLRAIYSERQLYEVMVDFWTNHFNVFAAKGANRWLITSYDRDVIRPHALGKFKDLLAATAKSPAMLFYLDNWMSADPNVTLDFSRLRELRAQRNRFGSRKELGPLQRLQDEREMTDRKANESGQLPQAGGKRKLGLNENYARELMELHTLGVDGGYTQKDIVEVARCFTGWSIARPRQGGGFAFVNFLHDKGEKTVLGQRIAAGGGQRDGERVLEILAHHPSTARFIATKLARRFVADEPPASLVARVADVFQKTDGDTIAMLRAIFASPEFNLPEAYRAKVKTPFELVVSAIRALGGETTGGGPLLRTLAEMGEALFLCQPPTGYADLAEAWVSTGAMVNRLNFGLALAANRLAGTRVDLGQFLTSPAKKDPEQLLTLLAEVVVPGSLSGGTLAILRKQLVETPGGNPDDRGGIGPARIAGLLLGSPEFQRQ